MVSIVEQLHQYVPNDDCSVKHDTLSTGGRGQPSKQRADTRNYQNYYNESNQFFLNYS